MAIHPHSAAKINALIVDSDMTTRMRLKQATSSVNEFGEVEQVGLLREAGFRLDGEKRYDVVFISHVFAPDEVTDFIKEAKKTKQGQDSAYVLVLKSKDQHNATVAASVMRGADGILFEPYSVDYLVELTNLAAKVRKERTDARERVALSLMLGEICNQLDLVSFLKSCDMEVARSMRKLSDLATHFRKLEPDKLTLYYEVAIECFMKAPVPKKAFQVKSYKGASDRVKKAMEKKILSELESHKTEIIPEDGKE